MKILAADDDPVSRTLLQALLGGWGYDVVTASDGLAAWRVLEADDAPKLAVLDWMMPGLEGDELCRRVRRRQGDEYVYLLILTAKDRRDDLVGGLEAGADDCISKPFFPAELRARLSVGRRILTLQAELIAAREAVRLQAMRDALTGVWNRGAVMDALEREAARASREGRPLALVMADLDHFKSVNDNFGHLAGDAVLREAARRMLGTARPYDLVGRYGGEEFLIVLPGCDAAEALRFGERLRERIAAPVADGPARIAVTVSLGVAAQDGPADAAVLLRAADEALYRAKLAGRNRVELAALPGAPPAAPDRERGFRPVPEPSLFPPPARPGDGSRTSLLVRRGAAEAALPG
jgi:diguanylate cyclase (GGDEF)-like protein